VLGVRPVLGPDSGTIQAFIAGQPIGPAFDLYASHAHATDSVWPLGLVPSGVAEVEIRVVGRNPVSSGLSVALDYFRWEPQIISADSEPGVWAGVAAVRGCAYETQDLGPVFSAGHHLWINPSERGASVDIEFNVPKAGDYDLGLRLTKSWDYAIVQAQLDGTDVGPKADCYSPTVVLSEPIPLGRVNLTAGRHILRLTAVDKNGESRGYLMGVDDLIVKAAR
jgi:hypothetical protein